MITIAIANQKGGVGKTTTAINIATAMAATGWKTLLLDLDPQGNASTGLGLPSAHRDRTSYDLLIEGLPVGECTFSSSIPHLDLLPATVDLSGAELELVGEGDRANRLRDALANHHAHDVCFIDCPPSLGLLTLNALTAADGVINHQDWYYNYGRTVKITHADNFETLYAHMSRFTTTLGPGSRVHKGDVIGYVGSTGRSRGSHLHFSVIVDGKFVDPAPYIAEGGGNALSGGSLVAFRQWQQDVRSATGETEPGLHRQRRPDVPRPRRLGRADDQRAGHPTRHQGPVAVQPRRQPGRPAPHGPDAGCRRHHRHAQHRRAGPHPRRRGDGHGERISQLRPPPPGPVLRIHPDATRRR